MKFETFWSKNTILPYWKKHFDNQTKYAIVDVRFFLGFWKLLKVVFYTKNDVVDLVREVVFDIVQKELTIPVQNCLVTFDDWENHQVKIELITDNDKLLVGKFNQNQNSLQNFLNLYLSNFFKTRYEVKLQFQNNKRNKISFQDKQ